LAVDIVTTAFEQLDAHDVVIGPSSDGGYYLVGFRQQSFTPAIFYNIPWSTGTVYAETIRKIHAAGCTYFALPEWWDVDVEDDLRHLTFRNRDQASERALHTLMYIRQHHLTNYRNRE
jgi:glycosyltransferase A (GT-A) superfamily protein (DUF2064 family)